MPRLPTDPHKINERIYDHTFAWSLLLEPRQVVELFRPDITMAPSGCDISAGSAPPYVRFPWGAMITAVAASEADAVITLRPDGWARQFSGPWLLNPDTSELSRPIVVPSHATLVGNVRSLRQDTHAINVWIRARIARV